MATKQAERTPRVKRPRQQYTFTPAQFKAMGGLDAPPDGYDPEQDRVVTIRHKGGEPAIVRHWNPTDQEGVVPASWPTIEAIAEEQGVLPLTIHWPDKYSPDFTAEPVG